MNTQFQRVCHTAIAPILTAALLILTLLPSKALPTASAQSAAGLFVSSQYLDSVDGTNALAWGDYDSDGDLDLATGNDGPSRVYRNERGQLTLGWKSDEQDSTYAVAWGDYDGDGDLDLVAGPRLYRNERGSFALVWQASNALNTRSAAWGDYDGDGDLDLAVGNGESADQVYRNDAGSFSLFWQSGIDAWTSSIAWGDYDGDGDLDLAAVGGGLVGWTETDRIYRNEGSSFTLAWQSAWYELNLVVAWGDYDADGDMDLATNSRIYRNDGGSLVTLFEFDGILPRSVAWGDYDNDGDLDFALGRADSRQVYQNNGGSFTLVWQANAIDYASSVAWGDVDGDGDLDLAVANAVGSAQIYRNELKVFALAWQGSAIQDTHSVAWGDYDSDGRLDLAISDRVGPLQIYHNQGGSLILALQATTTQNTWSLAWGDYDADGDLDLAVGNYSQPNRIYRNNQGTFTLAWQASISDYTESVAWGDYDGDGDLDLAVGNTGDPNLIYRNDAGTFGIAWQDAIYEWGSSVAWGDYDNDGDLDLVIGSGMQPIRVYRNDAGTFTSAWHASVSEWTQSIAWGDYDSDGDLDLAVGNSAQPNRVYRNDQGVFTAAWQAAVAENTVSVAWGDYDGDGDLDLAVGNYTVPNQVYRNDNGTFTSAWQASSAEGTRSVAWGDYDGDGDLDLAFGNFSAPARIYRNAGHTMASQSRLLTPIIATQPLAGIPTASNSYAVARITDNPIIAIPFTLRHPKGTAAYAVYAEYSLNGGGQWHAAVPAAGASLHNLAAPPGGASYSFPWDVPASAFLGQSDNVVVRLIAIPSLQATPSSAPLFQYSASTATTFPFRVRGTQVRVLSAARPTGEPGAIVYRIPADKTITTGLFAPGPGQRAYSTNAQGYLQGRGEITQGDTLVALAPIPPAQLPAAMQPFSNTLDLYATNITYAQSPTGLQLQGQAVTAGGVQAVTVDPSHPLALINLVVSIEWDARSDERFMSQLRYNLQRASELLFDATNGQAALGQIHLFFAKENWDHAHIRIYASNRVRPNAVIGGIATTPVTTTYTLNGQTNPISYGPGQIHIGATWNRYGEAGANLAEDWPRVLAHELGHYLFFLDDHYVGRNGTALQAVEYSTCPGLMHDPYASSELHPQADWLGARDPNCAATLSHQETGASDWTTLTAHYPLLNAPAGAFGAADSFGPATMALPFTDLYEYDPLTPTLTLDSPVFYTFDQATGNRLQLGPRSRAYLFQDDSSDADTQPNNRIIPLGRATLDQVLARGARVGDRVCVFEERQQWIGCQLITPGTEQLPVTQWGTGGRPPWRPDIAVTPVTSTTLQVRVANIESDKTVKAAIYAVENPLESLAWPTPITLSLSDGSYSGSFSLPGVLSSGFVHVWVEGEQPQREVVVQFAMEGNAGAGARISGGAGARISGGAGARISGGAGARISGGAGARISGGAGARISGGTFIRTGAATVATSEADVLFEDPDLSFSVGQFLLLQHIASPPSPPPGTSFVGTSYRFTTSVANPPQVGPQAAVSFGYMGSEVPSGEEEGIRIYYYNPANPAIGWQLLAETRLDTYHNLASARYRGPGIYALMSSLTDDLAPGWNNIAYPAQASRQVPDALASVAGKYRSVYSYNPARPDDPWELYSPSAPNWVSDLTCMRFSQVYLIASTSATTETLRFRNSLDPGEVTGCEGSPAALASQEPAPQALGAAIPPATYYGAVTSSANFSAVAGQTVVARVDDAVCGKGTTQLVDSQIVYRVHVGGATADAPGCGLPGRSVSFTVQGVPAGSTPWSNDMLHLLNLAPPSSGALIEFHSFLPIVRR